MKLFTQVSILLLIIFILTPFLSFTSHKYSDLSFINYHKYSDLSFANYRYSEPKLPLWLEQHERELLEKAKAQALSWQDSLLLVGGLITVGIGASVLARIVGGIVIGEKITAYTVQEAAKRAVVKTAQGAALGAVGGGPFVCLVGIPTILVGTKEKIVEGAETIFNGIIVTGMLGAVGGSFIGIRDELWMAIKNRNLVEQQYREAQEALEQKSNKHKLRELEK